MKRYIRSNWVADQTSRIEKAKAKLATYPKEHVDYVKQCRYEVYSIISRHQLADDRETDPSWPSGPSAQQVKNDWELDAINDGIMSEQEFNDIYDLLDLIALEYSETYASTSSATSKRVNMSTKGYVRSELEMSRRAVRGIAEDVISEHGENNSIGKFDRFIRHMVNNWADSGHDRDFIYEAIDKAYNYEFEDGI